jgi:hypothetical protein
MIASCPGYTETPCCDHGPTSSQARPIDPNQLGMIVELSTGEAREDMPADDCAAVAFARQGGLKGGKARADALTPQRRREIAQAAAKRRWGSKPK